MNNENLPSDGAMPPAQNEQPQIQQPDNLTTPTNFGTGTNINTNTESVASSQPVAPQVIQPVKGAKSKLLLILLIAAAVIVFGGGAMAYKFAYQNPDKVVTDSLTNALAEQGPVLATGTIKSMSSDANYTLKLTAGKGSGSLTGDANLNIDFKNENMFGSKSIVLSGQALYMQNGDIYVKPKDVKQVVDDLLNSYMDYQTKQYLQISGGISIPQSDIDNAKQIMHANLDPTIEKINNKWIKITADDIKSLSDESSKNYTCYSDFTKQLTSKDGLKELGDVYQKNKFITVKKQLGSKNGSLGYDLTIDEAKVKTFNTDSENTSIAKKLKACEGNVDDKKTIKSLDANLLNDDLNDIKTSNLQVWISRWSHKITSVAYSGSTNGTNDSNKSTVDVDLKFDYSKKINVSAPESSTPIKEVTDSFNKFGND